MLVLIGVLLVVVPVLAIMYPFWRGHGSGHVAEDENSTYSELSRRWEAAVAGLKNTELERAIGNISAKDYRWLREQYMTSAVVVMKAMELEEEQEKDLLAGIETEVRKARQGVLGDNPVDGATPTHSVQESGDE